MLIKIILTTLISTALLSANDDTLKDAIEFYDLKNIGDSASASSHASVAIPDQSGDAAQKRKASSYTANELTCALKNAAEYAFAKAANDASISHSSLSSSSDLTSQAKYKQLRTDLCFDVIRHIFEFYADGEIASKADVLRIIRILGVSKELNTYLFQKDAILPFVHSIIIYSYADYAPDYYLCRGVFQDADFKDNEKDNEKVLLTFIEKMVYVFPKLKKLVFRGYDHQIICNKIFKEIQKLTRLEELDLTANTIEEGALKLIQENKEIKTLRLITVIDGYANRSPEFSDDFLRSFPRLTSLETVFQNCAALSKYNIELTSLMIEVLGESDDDFPILASIPHEKLETLIIHGGYFYRDHDDDIVDDEEEEEERRKLQKLFSVLGTFKNLKEIELRHFWFEKLVIDFSPLNKLSQLRSFYGNQCYFSAQQIRNICQHIAKPEGLSINGDVYKDGIQIDIDERMTITELLSECPDLF